MCKRNGNPKKASRFICCKHMGENYLGQGIQRGGHQREKWHTKDLYCMSCKCITKNIEIRWCDTYDEVYDRAVRTRGKYYPKMENK